MRVARGAKPGGAYDHKCPGWESNPGGQFERLGGTGRRLQHDNTALGA